MAPHAPVISIIVWKEDISLPATYVQPVIQQYEWKLFKENFCNQSSYYENYGWFLLLMEAITCLRLFVVNKDKCNTKEDTGKSMKNALYVQQ